MDIEKNIGYERILAYLKECQKACPKGVSIKCVSAGAKKYLQLRFKLGEKERALACNCGMTMAGITEALNKSNLVFEALHSVKSESQFLAWYDSEILKKNKIKNDIITFGDAISQVEQAYWEGTDKKHRHRDRASISQQATYINVYGRFYKLLPSDSLFNVKDVLEALDTKERGTKVYGDCLYALKKLALTVGNTEATEALGKIGHIQTKFLVLQNAELESFLTWMEECLASASERFYHRRKQWLWVYSMQMLYGFRVHEVFAIQNIDKPFKTKDGVIIPPLTEVNNKKMIAVVGELTSLGTTTKTGYRLTAPMLPPSHPNLIEELDIRGGELPKLTSESENPLSITSRIDHSARKNLARWNAPITQTHALRHLCNQNGKQAGISAEARAANLGHSLAMNTATYLKREATNTRIAAIDAMSRQILPLEGAIAALKRIGAMPETISLIAEIYGISVQEVMDYLS